METGRKRRLNLSFRVLEAGGHGERCPPPMATGRPFWTRWIITAPLSFLPLHFFARCCWWNLHGDGTNSCWHDRLILRGRDGRVWFPIGYYHDCRACFTFHFISVCKYPVKRWRRRRRKYAARYGRFKWVVRKLIRSDSGSPILIVGFISSTFWKATAKLTRSNRQDPVFEWLRINMIIIYIYTYILKKKKEKSLYLIDIRLAYGGVLFRLKYVGCSKNGGPSWKNSSEIFQWNVT